MSHGQIATVQESFLVGSETAMFAVPYTIDVRIKVLVMHAKILVGFKRVHTQEHRRNGIVRLIKRLNEI